MNANWLLTALILALIAGFVSLIFLIDLESEREQQAKLEQTYEPINEGERK